MTRLEPQPRDSTRQARSGARQPQAGLASVSASPTRRFANQAPRLAADKAMNRRGRVRYHHTGALCCVKDARHATQTTLSVKPGWPWIEDHSHLRSRCHTCGTHTNHPTCTCRRREVGLCVYVGDRMRRWQAHTLTTGAPVAYEPPLSLPPKLSNSCLAFTRASSNLRSRLSP